MFLSRPNLGFFRFEGHGTQKKEGTSSFVERIGICQSEGWIARSTAKAHLVYRERERE